MYIDNTSNEYKLHKDWARKAYYYKSFYAGTDAHIMIDRNKNKKINNRFEILDFD